MGQVQGLLAYCLQMVLSWIIWSKPSFGKTTALSIILTFPCISRSALHSPIGKAKRSAKKSVQKKTYGKKWQEIRVCIFTTVFYSRRFATV